MLVTIYFTNMSLQTNLWPFPCQMCSVVLSNKRIIFICLEAINKGFASNGSDDLLGKAEIERKQWWWPNKYLTAHLATQRNPQGPRIWMPADNKISWFSTFPRIEKFDFSTITCQKSLVLKIICSSIYGEFDQKSNPGKLH